MVNCTQDYRDLLVAHMFESTGLSALTPRTMMSTTVDSLWFY